MIQTGQEEPAMKEVSIIGVDLAKQVFQLHGATEEALLRYSGVTRELPLPQMAYATRSISAVPSALKRFMRAMRMWISAV